MSKTTSSLRLYWLNYIILNPQIIEQNLIYLKIISETEINVIELNERIIKVYITGVI